LRSSRSYSCSNHVDDHARHWCLRTCLFL
jgi:hypothetical protein